MTGSSSKAASAGAVAANRPSTLADMLPIGLGWGLLVGDLWVHEAYLQMYTDALWGVLFAAAGSVSLAAIWLATKLLSPHHYSRLVRLLSAAALTAVLWRWFNAVLPAWGGLDHDPKLLVLSTTLAALCVAAWQIPPHLWLRVQRAMAAAFTLLILSAGVLASRTLPQPAWPARESGTGPDNIVFLLLDELGADAAGPIAQALEQDRWPVFFKPLRAVGDMTAKVVPHMFSGRAFPNARPCTPTTICDQQYSFSFSHVQVSRADIDIVGFYHPYCAIPHLRSCSRASPPFDILSGTRWGCAAARMAGLNDPSAATQCNSLPLQRWGSLVDQSLEAIRKAPFWSKGGMLFAHVPLPHPPGAAVGETLGHHYAANLKRAKDLVLQTATRARERFGDNVTIVVFSDHGLRYKHACASPLYARAPCDIPEQYRDARVPLIIAGRVLPNLQLIEDNSQVFAAAR